jgi:hypothetical protein
MKSLRGWLAFGAGLTVVAVLQTSGALAESGQQKSRSGIMNERSTGNEPFKGPGASGSSEMGLSVPGADEKSVQGGAKSSSGKGRTGESSQGGKSSGERGGGSGR